MSTYIEVEKIQHLIVETGDRHSRDGEDIHTCSSLCADLVMSVYLLPTADIAEVRHGKWIEDEFGSRCGVCGSYAYRDKFDKPWESPYCPLCGAKMVNKDD